MSCNLYADSIYPGEVWKDSSNNAINAHGGGFLYFKERYYWVGEYREKGRDLTQKISLYSSSNMINWKFEGVIFDASKVNSLLNIERPKIIFNEKSHTFVLWFHEEIFGNFNFSKVGVASSSKINNVFSYKHDFWPDAGREPIFSDSHLYNNADSLIADNKFKSRMLQGQMLRDMSIFVDDNNIAYLIYTSENNYSLHISELSSDYLSLTGRYSRVMVGQKNEAPTLFKRNDVYYIIASGLHGYAPTISKLASANNIFGPWQQHSTPFKSFSSSMVKNSFYSQPSYVLKLHNKDAYIFMADRWKRGRLDESTYVWLPIYWVNSLPTLYWKNSWELNDYTKSLSH